MAGPLLFHAPSAIEYFASLVADDASLPLVETAIAIAHVEYPELDCQGVVAEIDALAAKLRARIPRDAVAMQRLRWLNRFFFQELGFAGNVNDYYDTKNSYLHSVLQTRRGIPISLAVLYVELATQNGLHAQGVSFPGHFLVKVRLAQGEVVIDPFTGQSMSKEALDAMLVPYRRRNEQQGAAPLPLGVYLTAASPRDTIARMLRNLKEIHRSGEDWSRLVAVQDRLVVLLPDVWEERRDRGLAAAELGWTSMATDDLTAYLEHAPDATDRDAVAGRLVALAAGDRSRLH